MKNSPFMIAVIALTLFGAGCSKHQNNTTNSAQNTRSNSAATPTKISFLLTNDVHGHFAEKLSLLGTITQSIRNLPEYQNNQAALFVLDSGDQFQGTLLSNYDEGESIFKTFNEIGYDAVVPGNHDYDFGPLGWLFDKVRPGHSEDEPRGVITKLSKMAKFPLLSANTFLKSSIRQSGTAASISLDDSCKPLNASPASALDFTQATQPDFLKPYLIVEKAGVKVALIGIDNHSTSSTTTYDNVSDLCFRDEVETYLEIRNQLEGKADVFVLMMHNGNSSNSFDGSDIAKKINSIKPDGVHLVAAGHTHFTHDVISGGVHVIQDGANGKAYGRVDLFVDPVSHQVLSKQTLTQAGIPIDAEKCDRTKAAFACAQLTLPLSTHPAIDSIISDANNRIAPLAKTLLGIASEKVEINRVYESALGNFLADELRKATQTQIAIMNTGGIRTDIQKGEIRYENLFEVSPFQNQAVILKSLPWKTLKAALLAAVKTCGRYGSLVESGLKIQFSRDCKPNLDMDFQASLQHVELQGGQVLFDAATSTEVSPDTSFSVTTLDFLAAGGSGYDMFKGSTIDEVPGIARELIVTSMQKDQAVINNSIDHRFSPSIGAKVDKMLKGK